MAADQRQSIPDVRAVNPCSRNHLAGGRAGSPRDAGTQLSLSPRARDRAIKEDFDVDSTLQSRKRVGRHGAWGRGFGSGFTFSFFFRIPPFAGNEISAEISPKFANSERKGNSNSKNEISVNSDRNFGDFDRNFGDFDRKMKSVVIFPTVPEVK